MVYTRSAILQDFFIELRLELVGVAGDFNMILKNLDVVGDWDFKSGASLLKRISLLIEQTSCLLVMLSKESIKSN